MVNDPRDRKRGYLEKAPLRQPARKPTQDGVIALAANVVARIGNSIASLAQEAHVRFRIAERRAEAEIRQNRIDRRR